MFFLKNLIFIFLFSQNVFSHPFPVHPTELFIPIGESPGMSGIWTEVGCIVSINEKSRYLVIKTIDSTHTIYSSYRSYIFIDRSKDRLTNFIGSFFDFKIGMLVEVDFVSHIIPNEARWVKLEVTKNPTPCPLEES